MKATLADMRSAAARGAAVRHQDLRVDLQEPRGRARRWAAAPGVLLDEAGCRGLTVGGARFSEKHANFVENTGGATTADVVALMAEGRRRVHERFGVALEPEVQVLGDVDAAAPVGEPVSAAPPSRPGRVSQSWVAGRLPALPAEAEAQPSDRARASRLVLASGYQLWLRDSAYRLGRTR